jgi:sulfate-transporting ATPase
VAAEWARVFRLAKRAKKWGRPYIIRLDQVADTDTEHHSNVPARTLTLEGLTVRYGAVTAVDDVGFRLEPGRVTGLIGPNGAGKTSLIDALSGFTGASGRVLLDDEDVSKWSPTRRARAGIARSFQSLELFEDSTVFENISVAADPQDFRSYLRDLVWPINPPFPPEVVRAIKEFQLDEDLHRDVNDLSYGKRRLLAIARAVAMHPSVLLLDEPAAGLSSAESAELGTVVRRLADEWGMAILVVEHDMNFVMEVCDDVVVLDFGRLIAAGPPDAVRSDPSVIAAYLGNEIDEHEGDFAGATPTTVVGGGA